MSSSAKTEKLRLNQWSGDDKPKREDFNQDNRILEDQLGGHIADAGIHLTGEEKERLQTLFKTGSYLGTGEADKTVNLPFRPKAVFVFAQNRPFAWADANGKINSYAAAAIANQHTVGMRISGEGFVVSDSGTAVQGDWVVSLNKINLTYFYIAFP